MSQAPRPDPTTRPAQARSGRDGPVAEPGAAGPLANPEGLLPRVPGSQVSPRTVVVVVFTLLAMAAGLYLLWRLSEILQWIVIALFLAVALAVPVDLLNRRRLPRVLAILVVYLAVLLAFG